MKLAALLAPGAGAGPDHPALLAIEEALAPAPVSRLALPRSRAVEAVRKAAAELSARASLEPGRLVLGGRSYGGRMCSEAVADGLPALGLALVSYPLHPPGRPAQLRNAHFARLQLPCLFVSGTRDAFATPAELETAVAAIAGPVTVIRVEGADHGMRGRDAEVAEAVRAWVLGLPG
jgi:predicted alpha/beta-hydrolase family hydrolase